MRIAFAAFANQPAIAADEQSLAAYLAEQNITVVPVVWDDPNADWRQYDAVVIRSTWDYYRKVDAFASWLDTLEALGCTVLNPVSVIRWNKHKEYLNRFAEQGIAVPDYVYCHQLGSANLSTMLQERGWHKAVVKPAISAGAFNTWVTTTATAAADQAQFDTMLRESDVIVQTFMDEIHDGEISLVFFNKTFNHAVRKNAAEGDFRIQTQYGGTITAITPTPEVLHAAEAVMKLVSTPLLYARVDGLIGKDGTFYLMELELIEPRLYMQYGENANENFYNALRKLLSIG